MVAMRRLSDADRWRAIGMLHAAYCRDNIIALHIVLFARRHGPPFTFQDDNARVCGDGLCSKKQHYGLACHVAGPRLIH